MSRRYVICTAITERQRDLLAAGFREEKWTKRWAPRRTWSGRYERREETRSFDIKIRQVVHPDSSIYGPGVRWEFVVPSQEQHDAGWTLGHYILLDQFKPGMRVRFLSSNGATGKHAIVKGDLATVVDVYAGDLYIHKDGWEPTPTKPDGTPDLNRTPQIGAYWVEPTEEED